MSSEEIATLVTVLQSTLSPDNQTRNNAEMEINKLRGDAPKLVYCLLKVVELEYPEDRGWQYQEVKLCAGVLARSIMKVKEGELVSAPWQKMNPGEKEEIKRQVISACMKEKNPNLKEKITDVVIEVANNVFESDDEKWDDVKNLLSSLLTLDPSNSDNHTHIESGLSLLEGVFSLMYEDLMGNIDTILEALRNFLKSDNLTLKTKAIKTVSSMITFCDKKDNKNFKEFIFPLLEISLRCLQSNRHDDENNLKLCLKSITDISVSEPGMLKNHFPDLFILMGKVIEKKDFVEDNIREMGFEVLVTLVERKNYLFAKDETKLKAFLELIFKFALEMDIEVTEEWAVPSTNSYYDAEFIEEENVASAFSYIGRLLEHLSPELMLKHLSEIVMQLLQSDSDFRYKYLAMLTLSQIAGKIDDMAMLDNITPIVFEMTSHKHPKVRYASINCLNEFADNFQPHFEEKFHSKMIPMLVERINTEQVLRTKLEAVETLDTFLSHMKSKQASQYLEQLVHCIFAIFEGEIPLILRTSLLELLAELTTTTEGNFAPFAEKSMNYLLTYFEKIYKEKIYRPLLGNLIDCISLIGPQTEQQYLPILPDLVKVVVELTESIPTSTDPIKRSIQDFFERVIPLLIKHYKDYLPTVINAILNLIKKSPEMSLSSKPEDTFNVKELITPESLSEKKVQIKSTTLKTSQTEDLAESIDLLNTSIEALDESFLPYIPQTLEIVLPYLHYYINEEVRQNAANTLPLIIQVLSTYSSREETAKYGKTFIKDLLTIIEHEFDENTQAIELENLGEVINKAGAILSKEEVNRLFKRVLEIFDNVEKRRLALMKTKKEVSTKSNTRHPDDDESDTDFLEDIEKDIEDIEMIQSDIGDVIGFLFKTHVEVADEVVEKLIKELLPKYLRDGATSFETKMALFIVDDMIEFLGQDYLKSVWNNLAEVTIKLSNSRDHSIRQAACYGVGIFAQYTKYDYHQYAQAAIDSLDKALLVNPDEHNEHDWGLARDNAVAGLGRIIKYQGKTVSELVPFDQLVNKWLSYLPVKYDLGESFEQHELLCDLFLQEPAFVVGKDLSKLPNFIRLTGRIHKTKLANSQINTKIQEIYQKIKANDKLKEETSNIVNAFENGKIKNKLENLLT